MKKTLLLLLLTSSSYINAQTINTLTGNGSAGFSGDNNPATAAIINSPFGLATDISGNVYFADRSNNRIRKIDAAGIITTIAGNGAGGYNGDNIAATSAQLFDPYGVAVDGMGNVYIADKSNNRIRKIDASGIITTIVGTGTAAFGGDNSQATAADINNPRGLAVDTAGNIFIADQANNRVRKINTSGIITTIAGNGTLGFNGDNNPATAAMLNGPYALAINKAGDLFICDVDNERIRKVNSAGIITTVAGTGVAGYNADHIAATSANLNEPIGVAVDTLGNIYIADGWNNRIRRINASGIISTIIGDGVPDFWGDGGPASAARLHNPYAIAINMAGQLFISDNGNNRIRYTTALAADINDVGHNIGLQLFPNPSPDGGLYLNVSSTVRKNVTLYITNMAGIKVYENLINTNELTGIQLNEPAGIYLLSILTSYGVLKKEIVIER